MPVTGGNCLIPWRVPSKSTHTFINRLMTFKTFFLSCKLYTSLLRSSNCFLFLLRQPCASETHKSFFKVSGCSTPNGERNSQKFEFPPLLLHITLWTFNGTCLATHVELLSSYLINIYDIVPIFMCENSLKSMIVELK